MVNWKWWWTTSKMVERGRLIHAVSPAVGWWLVDSQTVHSGTEEIPVRGYISFRYQAVLVPPQTCPFCIWKTTYTKSWGCYLAHHSCSPNCTLAPLLWTQPISGQGTLLSHPTSAHLCRHTFLGTRCFSVYDANSFLNSHKGNASWWTAEHFL